MQKFKEIKSRLCLVVQPEKQELAKFSTLQLRLTPFQTKSILETISSIIAHPTLRSLHTVSFQGVILDNGFHRRSGRSSYRNRQLSPQSTLMKFTYHLCFEPWLPTKRGQSTREVAEENDQSFQEILSEQEIRPRLYCTRLFDNFGYNVLALNTTFKCASFVINVSSGLQLSQTMCELFQAAHLRLQKNKQTKIGQMKTDWGRLASLHPLH